MSGESVELHGAPASGSELLHRPWSAHSPPLTAEEYSQRKRQCTASELSSLLNSPAFTEWMSSNRRPRVSIISRISQVLLAAILLVGLAVPLLLASGSANVLPPSDGTALSAVQRLVTAGALAGQYIRNEFSNLKPPDMLLQSTIGHPHVDSIKEEGYDCMSDDAVVQWQMKERDLQKTISELQSTIFLMESETDILNSTSRAHLEALQSQCSEYKTAWEELQYVHVQMEERCTKANEKIQSLSVMLKDYEKQLQQALAERDAVLEARISQDSALDGDLPHNSMGIIFAAMVVLFIAFVASELRVAPVVRFSKRQEEEIELLTAAAALHEEEAVKLKEARQLLKKALDSKSVLVSEAADLKARLADAEARLAPLQGALSENAALTSRVATLEGDLADAEERLVTMQGSLADAESRSVSAQAAESESAGLASQIDTMKRSLADAESQLSAMRAAESNNAALMAELNRLKGSLADAEHQLSGMQQTMSENVRLAAQVESLKGSLAAAEASLAAMDACQGELRVRSERAEEDVQKLQEEVISHSGRAEEMEAKCFQYISEIEKAKAEASRLQGELEAGKRHSSLELENANQTILNLQDQLGQQISKLASAQASAAAASESFGLLAEQLNDALMKSQSRIMELEQALKESFKKQADISQELARMKGQCGSISSSHVHEPKKVHEGPRTEVGNHGGRGESGSAQQTVQELKLQIGAQAALIKDAQQGAAHAASAATSLAVQVLDMAKMCELLKASLGAAHQRENDLQKELAAAEYSADAFASDHARLLQHAEDLASCRDQLEEELLDKENQLHEMSRTICDLEKELVDRQAEVGQLTMELLGEGERKYPLVAPSGRRSAVADRPESSRMAGAMVGSQHPIQSDSRPTDGGSPLLIENLHAQVEQLEQSLWSITKSKSQLEEQLRLAQHELQESQSYIEQLEAHCEGLQVDGGQDDAKDSPSVLSKHLSSMSRKADSLRQQIIDRAKSVPDGVPTPLRRVNVDGLDNPSTRRSASTDVTPNSWVTYSLPRTSASRVRSVPNNTARLEKCIARIRLMFDDARNHLTSGTTPNGAGDHSFDSEVSIDREITGDWAQRVSTLQSGIGELLDLLSDKENMDVVLEKPTLLIAEAEANEVKEALRSLQARCRELEELEDDLRLQSESMGPSESPHLNEKLKSVQEEKREAYASVDDLLLRQVIAASECDRLQPLSARSSPAQKGSVFKHGTRPVPSPLSRNTHGAESGGGSTRESSRLLLGEFALAGESQAVGADADVEEACAQNEAVEGDSVDLRAMHEKASTSSHRTEVPPAPVVGRQFSEAAMALLDVGDGWSKPKGR